MRVGFIAPALTTSSGWGRHTLDLIAALGAQGVEAFIITTDDAPGTVDVPHVGYVPTLPTLSEKRGRGLTPRSLIRGPAARRFTRGCDLVHCTVEPFAPLAAFATPTGKPFVITAHGTYLPYSIRRRVVGRLFAWATRQAAAVVCVSHYTETQVKATLPEAKTVVVHNGVHWQRFARREDTLPPKPKRGPVILGVGQVKKRKGFHVVAQAMQTVRQTHPDAEYVIIGSTAGAPDLAAELDATPGVRVLGRVDDATLLAWYHHADLLAQTPVNVAGAFEGFGLVYLEAGAAGLPSVGARGSGAQEAIVHEETGLLVPQDDPHATAEALLRLLDDDALRARLAEGAHRHAQVNGWDRVAAQMIDIYQRIR